MAIYTWLLLLPALMMVLGMTVLNLVFLIILRPYSSHLHNLAIIFNQIVVGCTLGAFLFVRLTTNDSNASSSASADNEIYCQVFVYTIVGLMFVVVFWSAIRLWRVRMAEKAVDDPKKKKSLRTYDEEAYGSLLSIKRPKRNKQ